MQIQLNYILSQTFFLDLFTYNKGVIVYYYSVS